MTLQFKQNAIYLIKYNDSCINDLLYKLTDRFVSGLEINSESKSGGCFWEVYGSTLCPVLEGRCCYLILFGSFLYCPSVSLPEACVSYVVPDISFRDHLELVIVS